MGLPQPVGYLFWYTTSVILGILTLINIVSITIRHLARRAQSQPGSKSQLTSTDLDSTCSSPTTSSHSEAVGSAIKDVESVRIVRRIGAGERFGRAVTLGMDKYVGLSAIPLPRIRWWVKRPTNSVATTEVIWTIIYSLGCLILSFYGTDMQDFSSYANQAAWIAVAQMPLIIALAGKNNLVSFLTGISYEKLNFLHRAAGRVCFLCVWIHSGGHFYNFGGFHSENWATQLSRWGFTGLLAFTLLNVTSLRWVRHRIYEFFLITHILLAALTLAAFIMHWRAVDKWIYPGVGLWAFDRLFRILRLFVLNKLWTVIPSPTASNLPSTATLTLLTPSTLKVSFQTPSSMLKWSAGQHFYVVMPGMARLPWEAHPFTAATVPSRSEDGGSGELTFIVRVRDGFTKRMKERVDKERKAQGLGVEEECKIEVKAAVEGAYGQVRKLDLYDGVLIVAGGSGISFAVAHLLQVIQDAKAGRPHPRHFSIIWMVKSRLHLNWIAPILLAHASDIPSTLRATLHIHVTRQYIPRASISLPPTSELPADPSQLDDTWSTYLAKRAAEPPRRKSRLLSTMSWATWTGAFDTNNENSGSGGSGGTTTRRGSLAVPGVGVGQASHRPTGSMGSGPTHSVSRGEEPKFMWSEGYNDGETPATIVVEKNEEEGDQDQEVRESEKVIPRTSFAYMPESPRRTTSGLPSPLGPRAIGTGGVSVTGKSSTGILLDTPPRRKQSISIEEPTVPSLIGRRRSSVQSGGTPPSPSGSSRRGSTFLPHLPALPALPPIVHHALGGPRRKSSGLLHVTLPETETETEAGKDVGKDGLSPPIEDENEVEDKDDPFFLPPPRPFLNNPFPTSTSMAVEPGMLSAPIMIKSSSQNSGITIRSTSSSTTPFIDILHHHHHHHHHSDSSATPGGESEMGGSSGIRTPSLSVQKPDLSLPADLSNPSAILEQAFTASSQDRAKQSIGLEGIVQWHEGRADLYKMIEGMMAAVGKGGVVDVEACGPRSLLDKTKDVVKELSDVKAVWNGETKVIYHAETFGW